MFRSEFTQEEFPYIPPAYLSSQRMKDTAVMARATFVLGLVGTIASIIILALGCSSIFGSTGSPGFIGSIVCGSIGTFVFSVPTALLLASRHREIKNIEKDLIRINEVNAKNLVLRNH